MCCGIAVVPGPAMDPAGSVGNFSTPPHTGTTIVAVSYNGGVVLAADSRVSTGNYISNRASNKITSLSDSVYLLRSGSASDTQAVADYGAPRGVMHWLHWATGRVRCVEWPGCFNGRRIR